MFFRYVVLVSDNRPTHLNRSRTGIRAWLGRAPFSLNARLVRKMGKVPRLKTVVSLLKRHPDAPPTSQGDKGEYNRLFLFGEIADCTLCLFPADPPTRLSSGLPMYCGSCWKPSGLESNDQAMAQRPVIEAPSDSSCFSFGSRWDWTLRSLFSSLKRPYCGSELRSS